MILTTYSIVWGIILFTAGIITGYFFMKKGDRRMRLAAGFLFLLSICRILLPVDLLSARNIDIKYIYPQICLWLRKENDLGLSVSEGLLLIWGIVSAVLFFLMCVRQLYQSYRISRLPLFSPESRIYRIYRKAKKEVGCRQEALLVKAPFADIMSVGFFKPVILMPSYIDNLSDTDLDHIIRHELYHYLKGDLWFKLIMQIFLALLWWNPAIYLLRSSLEQFLELRCDRNVCKQFSIKEKYYYAKTLYHTLTLKKMKRNYLFSGYGGNHSNECLLQRTRCLLNEEPKASVIRIAITISMAVFLFAASYCVNPQPSGMPSPEEMEGTYTLNELPEIDRRYILRCQNGTLEYYEDDLLTKILQESDLEKEPYCSIPLYEAYK